MSTSTPKRRAGATRAPHDVGVVGGGIAGLTAAMALARRGRRVALFEAKRYPFHRLCGEFLSPEFEALAATVGFDVRPLAAIAAPMRRTRFTAPWGRPFEDALPGTALGVSRYAIDAELARQARAAGAEVHEGEKVRSVRCVAPDGTSTIATDSMELECRRVLLATGKLRTEWRRLVAEGAAVEVQQGPLMGLKQHGHLDGVGDVVEIHTFPGGYCGVNPIEGGRMNVCLIARTAVFKPHRTPERFLAWIATQNRHLGARLAAFRPLDEPVLAVQSHFDTGAVEDALRPREALLAGDASGMVSPLAGEGMCLAMRGGRAAAVLLDAHLAGWTGWDEVLRLARASELDDKGGLMRLGKVLEAALFQPALASSMVSLLSVVGPLRRAAIVGTRKLSPELPAALRRLASRAPEAA